MGHHLVPSRDTVTRMQKSLGKSTAKIGSIYCVDGQTHQQIAHRSSGHRISEQMKTTSRRNRTLESWLIRGIIPNLTSG